jgi:long-chain acyl-CoA synthetase
MSQAVGARAANVEAGGAELVAKYRAARQAERSAAAERAQLGAKIIFDTLQYAMFDNVAEAFHFNADLNPELTHVKQPVIQQWTEGEKRRPVERLSAADVQSRQQKLAHYLRGIGVKAGTRVAIVSADGPNWSLFETAVWDADGEVVNIYVRNTAERTGFCLVDSGAKIVVVQNQEQLDKLLQIMAEPFTVEGHEEREEYEATLELEKLLTINPVTVPEKHARFAPLIQPAEEILEGPDPPERLLSTRGPEDIANIVYTSGSSGAPKGVLCSHGATLHNLRMLARSGIIDFANLHQAKTESDLPHIFTSLPERAHAFPMRIGHCIATSPAIGVYPAEVDKTSNKITPEFRESIGRDHRENAMGIEPTVPKILSQLRKKIIANMDEGGIKGKFAKLVALNAARHLRCRALGKYRPLTALLYQLLTPVRQMVSRIIKTQFAQEQFDVFISGGAALPLETDTFFWALEIPILEGYGSSETNCPVFINRQGEFGVEHMNGTVGYVLAPDVRVKFDPEVNEILISAPCLASGYLNRPTATAKAWVTDNEGVVWYRTKDVGEFVAGKFLRLKGRCDDVLVLDNGENVGATEVSDRFDACRLVNHGIVFGHKKPALTALVTLNYGELKRRAQQESLKLGADFDTCPVVKGLVEQEIKQHVNSEGRVFEKIRAFAIIPPLSIEQGTLTGKEEPVRRKIEEEHAELIESLYKNQSAWICK